MDPMIIGKRAGVVRNAKLLMQPKDTPDFLLQDGAVELTEDGTQLRMWHYDGEELISEIRSFPMVLKWEKMSKNLRSLLERSSPDGTPICPQYGTYPFDEAISAMNDYGIPYSTTLSFSLKDGTCFLKRIDSRKLKAALITNELPEGIAFGALSPWKSGNEWFITTRNGSTMQGEMLRSVWVEYEPGDVSILCPSDPIVSDFLVFDGFGNTYCLLSDLLGN